MLLPNLQYPHVSPNLRGLLLLTPSMSKKRPFDVHQLRLSYRADYVFDGVRVLCRLCLWVSFEVVSNGNATPRWQFANVSANTGGPFLELDRTRKDTLQITMGPTQLATAGRKVKPIAIPSQAVINQDLASQIGNQVANSLNRIR